MRFGGRPIRSSGLSVSERKMAPLVCHQWQKCADCLTAEAGLARCGPSKTMPEELPVWHTARGTRSTRASGYLSIYSLKPHAHGRSQKHFNSLTPTSTGSDNTLLSTTRAEFATISYITNGLLFLSKPA